MTSRAFAFAFASTIASRAGADETACTTSSECGARNCIEGRCTTAAAILNARREHERARYAPKPPGFEPLYGNGAGYVAAMIIADVAVSVTALAPWSLAYIADDFRHDEGFQWLALSQLAAPSAIHFAHHRVVFGVFSLIGWSAVALEAYFVPQAFSPTSDDARALAPGLAFAISGAIGMTVADAFMARTVAPPKSNVAWSASVAPARGGAIGMFGCAW